MKSDLVYQPELFAEEADVALTHARFNARSGAFVDNMSLPVHRWYRYSAGFSADWVRALIEQLRPAQSRFSVLDPFAGVGTTLLASEASGAQSWGFETHPFIYRVAMAKIRGIHVELLDIKNTFADFLNRLPDGDSDALPKKLPILLSKCYTPNSLATLFSMRDVFLREFDHKTAESELIWLAITSILRMCSGAGTAQWQYVLPNKRKAEVRHPIVALRGKMTDILQDIEYAQRNAWSAQGEVILTDARSPAVNPRMQVDAVITSPPYPNNYDYADATRLEMTFWGEIAGWSDLQQSVRRHLIHSCSQHAAAEKLDVCDLLAEPILDPIREELSAACATLAEVRQSKGGKKTYHSMAAAYFRDLAQVFNSLRPLCRAGSLLCFVIGDSAPYGVYLDVDKWLGELALNAGFKSYSFEKVRDRNVKWKNRKHRVPLKEGRLWIKG